MNNYHLFGDWIDSTTGRYARCQRCYRVMFEDDPFFNLVCPVAEKEKEEVRRSLEGLPPRRGRPKGSKNKYTNIRRLAREYVKEQARRPQTPSLPEELGIQSTVWVTDDWTIDRFLDVAEKINEIIDYLKAREDNDRG